VDYPLRLATLDDVPVLHELIARSIRGLGAADYTREYREHGHDAASLLVATKELKQILKRPNPDMWDLANAYVAAGMRDETLRTLDRGLQIHEPGLLQLRVDPDFSGVRNNRPISI